MNSVHSQRRETFSETPVKVLAIEDNPVDADLARMALRRAGVAHDFRVAGDQAELRAALETFVPDIVLCDFALPGFDGFAAQRIVREVFADVPLVFVTGTVSEERAVVAVQSGAVDFVLKSNLTRLPSVVQRSVTEAREKKRLETALEGFEARVRRQALRLELLWRTVNDPDLQGPGLIPAMLRQAAGTVRPNQRFRGLLSRVDANDIVAIAVGIEPGDEDSAVALPMLGSRRPKSETLVPSVSRSQAWDDLRDTVPLPRLTAEMGWRSLIATSFVAAGQQYSLTLSSLEATTIAFGPEDIGYLEVLASTIARLLEVNELTDTLREAEERSHQHAARLEALWRLVNDPALRDEELWPAMLELAATGMQPGHPYRGTLWRIAGDEMVVEAFADAPGEGTADTQVHVGFALTIAGTAVGRLLAEGGGTRSWDDMQADTKRSAVVKWRAIRSLVATTFSAGGTTWALTFSSNLPAGKRLRAEEHAFVEILASFFANRVQQRWQFERIQYQQSHDVLTGLLSRSQFRSQARSAFRTSTRCAMIVVDVNAFREVNDSYGHMVGDAILVEVGNALRKRAGEDDIVGRIGGDVFAIYLPDPPSRDYVLSRAAEFAAAFASGFSTGDRAGTEFISRTASLGIAIAPADGIDIDTILSHAHAALLNAKQRGHATTVFYEEGMEGDAQRRAFLRNELAEAIAQDQFTLYYQPHVEIKTGAVTGCEALIRWNHPVRGLLLPGEFIPFAEQSGIIAGIDDWVLRNACKASRELGAVREDFRLYFNLSGRQAGDPKLIRALTAAARDGVPLKHLGVEITESDAMRDVEATRRVCRALRKLNVRVAIDDFGTGYSSLSVLKRLPVDIVKIDRSFISGVLSDPHDETIAETIISISERFGFESLAEGAEHLDEIEWLRKRSCNYVQGYAVCHPLPMDEFKSWLTSRDRNDVAGCERDG
jgi:diguanylate cyclase (GGDEF)-like protein